MQSIADQFAWARQEEARRGFTIVGSEPEEKSAKEPGTRPVFADALRRIQAGEADGFLAWQINRLSRNPVDSGTLQWLLQREVIKVIATSERDYWPSDNSLLLSMDTGMSTQYIRDLTANTWRGMEAKMEQGWFPSRAPQGYMNEPQAVQGRRRILVDPDRWDTIRRIWELMLTGSYNPKQITRIVNANGYRTPTNTPISHAGVYSLLTNIFYTGQFMIRGQPYAGQHRQMVTIAEYNRVQALLGERGRPRPQSHEFAYTGMIRCGECRCMITAETKIRYLKTTAQLREYTYYHCTKAGAYCSQPAIRVEALEKQITARLSNLAVHPDVATLVTRIIDQTRERDSRQDSLRRRQSATNLSRLKQELYDLQKTYTKGTLDDDFYLAEKATLKHQLTAAERATSNGQSASPSWLDLADNAFLLAARALAIFPAASLRTKREILTAIGAAFELRDGQLSYEPSPWFRTIADHRELLISQLKTENRIKTSTNIWLWLKEINVFMNTWYPVLGEIRKQFEAASTDGKYVYIPRLDDTSPEQSDHIDPNACANTDNVTAA